ncbi:MAG: thioredoxin-disulfide reductase [Planctomycetes bacterium]|nr:thioredoxin-disulfide reductase [Planctomycetota bacterium]
MSTHDRHTNVMILGSGPAGWTAAIYAARANLAPMVLHGPARGGQLMLTTEVENYPGFEHGIMGPKLMELFEAQAARFGTRIVQAWATEVDLTKRPFTVKTATDGDFTCDSLVIATGAEAMWLDLPNEVRIRDAGGGVSACATCDGAFFKNKELVVVGGGDTAMEEANFLTRYATKVTVVHRRDKLRASKIMADRATKNPKISFVWDSAVVDVLDTNGNKKIRAVVLENLKSKERTEFACGGLFIAIGHKPNTELFVGKLDCDAKGYLVTDAKSTATKIPGVFACGDVQDSVYRQAVTAAGTGCMAAIDAERWLEANGAGH